MFGSNHLSFSILITCDTYEVHAAPRGFLEVRSDADHVGRELID